MGRREDERAARRGLTVRPFESLESLRNEVDVTPSSVRGAKEGNERRSSVPADPLAEQATAVADDDAFAAAMADVVPLKDKDRVSRAVYESSKPPRATDEAAAVDAYLRDLVDGVVPFDIADTDEYIEGAVQGFDHRVLRRLRRGEFAVQSHLDLHGHTRDEARTAVAKFLKKSHAEGLRCVLIVHGRGLNSKDQIPVLKEKLKAWLTRGSLGTIVLAFASARSYDGGTGAAYVLLRR